MSEILVRQRRIHRARTAAWLLSWDATDNADLGQGVDWAALETVPHWCLLGATEKKRLQLLCGALFFAPVIQRLIDGRRIQQLHGVIGVQAYEAVLNFPLACAAHSASEIADRHTADFSASDTPVTESSLLDAGESVLLGAVQHPAIAEILSRKSGHDKVLPRRVAEPLYQRAQSLYDELSPVQAASQHEASA